MKKSLLIAGLFVGGVAAFAQDGAVQITNLGGPSVYDVDGTTKLSTAKGQFEVIYNGSVIAFNPATAGKAPSFITPGNFSANNVTIPGTTEGQTVSLTINVWDKTTGATYSSATVKGSETISVIVHSGTTPTKTIFFAGNPTPWKALTLSTTVVPEPSTYALAALGLGGLFFVSRRK